MRPYLDFSFLIHLVALAGERSRIASGAIQQFRPPFLIHDLHVLQVENFFRHTVQRDPHTLPLMTRAAVRWRNHLSELVYEPVEFDWGLAASRAVAVNRLSSNWPGPPLALIHLEAAQLVGSTHFLSFDSRQRALAAKAGLQIVPEVLS
jgi:hypothetical protein